MTSNGLARAQSVRSQAWRVLLAAAVVVGGVALAPTQSGAAATPRVAASGAHSERLIVQVAGPQLRGVRRAVVRLGGRVASTQEALATLVVELPAGQLGALRAVPGVQTVTLDRAVHLASSGGVSGSTGDLANVARQMGATSFWRNGFAGQGVDVALLDSGVLPVEGLTTPGKLVIGPDLSLESQSATLSGLDTFGHGTHMAGIIGGRDAGTTRATYATDSTHFLGIAPDSRLVSIKLADALGRTDVSQVIAGIDWVVEHAHDPGMNIRVLNLSFGTDSQQDYRIDPLVHAAEVAWSRGIVVVVSAGNGQTAEGGLSDPAYAPGLLAVGSVDSKGTDDSADDDVSDFSKKGNSASGKRGPDVLAPGASVVSLRAPGSYIDSEHGGTGRVGTRFFKGSGTSQAAAVVSGAAALILSQHPELGPDQVKDLLVRSAAPLKGREKDAQGAGVVNLATAATLPVTAVGSAVLHSGGGSLDAARGSLAPTLGGRRLGERTILGTSLNSQLVSRLQELLQAWSAGSYNGTRWTGSSWLGAPANGASWTGTKWTGATWAGTKWTGATWADVSWAGTKWTGATWAGATWNGATWAGATWAGATWAGATWADGAWSSQGWQ